MVNRSFLRNRIGLSGLMPILNSQSVDRIIPILTFFAGALMLVLLGMRGMSVFSFNVPLHVVTSGYD